MNEEQLRELILFRVRSGHLPKCPQPHTLFGGKGEGCECDCCGGQIMLAQVQYEVDSGIRTFQMHLHCYDVWCGTQLSAAL